jgi:hypothetical protein
MERSQQEAELKKGAIMNLIPYTDTNLPTLANADQPPQTLAVAVLDQCYTLEFQSGLLFVAQDDAELKRQAEFMASLHHDRLSVLAEVISTPATQAQITQAVYVLMMASTRADAETKRDYSLLLAQHISNLRPTFGVLEVAVHLLLCRADGFPMPIQVVSKALEEAQKKLSLLMMVKKLPETHRQGIIAQVRREENERQSPALEWRLEEDASMKIKAEEQYWRFNEANLKVLGEPYDLEGKDVVQWYRDTKRLRR